MRKEIDAETYESIREELCTELVEQCLEQGVLLTDAPVDVHLDELLSYQCWQRHFGEYTRESIAREADTPAFNPYDRVDFACTADNIVDQVAFWTVYTDLENAIEDRADNIDRTLELHRTLEHAHVHSDRTPSALVNQFFSWVGAHGEQVASNSVGLDDLNESHIRGRTVLDHRDTDLLTDLTHWVDEELPATATPEDFSLEAV